MSNFSTQNEESCSKTNGLKFRFALGDLMRTMSNCSGIFLLLIKPLGTAPSQNKAFFLLHTSVENTFEFKEILCFYSLNFIGIQIAFSLTYLFNCSTIFSTFILIIFYLPGNKYWHSFQRLFFAHQN